MILKVAGCSTTAMHTAPVSSCFFTNKANACANPLSTEHLLPRARAGLLITKPANLARDNQQKISLPRKYKPTARSWNAIANALPPWVKPIFAWCCIFPCWRAGSGSLSVMGKSSRISREVTSDVIRQRRPNDDFLLRAFVGLRYSLSSYLIRPTLVSACRLAVSLRTPTRSSCSAENALSRNPQVGLAARHERRNPTAMFEQRASALESSSG